MKSLRTLAIAALIAGSSALASAQSWDHRDRDDWRFRSGYVVRSYPAYSYSTYYVGEQRYYNGYNWTWDGNRWRRHDRGLTFYLNF